MVLSSWHCYCESSPGSSGKCNTSARWLPTFGPSQSTWASDQPVGFSTSVHSQSPFIITQPKSWYSFYQPMERRLSWTGC